MNKHDLHNTGTANKMLSDPLGNYPSRFRSHLEGQHYSPSTIAVYGRCIAALGELLRGLQIDTASLTESITERLIKRLQRRSCRKTWTAFAVKRFVRYLIEQGAAPSSLPSPDDTARGRL